MAILLLTFLLPISIFAESDSVHSRLHRRFLSETERSSIWHQRESISHCNLWDGKWMHDRSRYADESSNLMNPAFNFSSNCAQGKRSDDTDYIRFSWNPRDCAIPKFNASDFRQRMKNKQLAFVGDSIAKDQYHSFLTMISEGLQESDFETNAPLTESVVVCIKEFNFTIRYYLSQNLVRRYPSLNRSAEILARLALDEIDPTVVRAFWASDLIVYSSDHWFHPMHLQREGSFPMVNQEIRLDMQDFNDVYAAAMDTFFKWAYRVRSRTTKLIFLRSLSPTHSKSLPLICGKHLLQYDGPYMEHSYGRFFKIVNNLVNQFNFTQNYLNVTYLTFLRNDGHVLWNPLNGHSDCGHWCTPGVPDTWNQLLYVQLLRNEQPPFN